MPLPVLQTAASTRSHRTDDADVPFEMRGRSPDTMARVRRKQLSVSSPRAFQQKNSALDKIFPWRKRLLTRLERWDTVAEYVSVGIVAVSVVLFVVGSIPALVQYSTFWQVMDVISVVVFTLEILVRAFCAPCLLDYAKDPFSWVDVIVVVPLYIEVASVSGTLGQVQALRVLRLVQVFRIFKLWRYGINARIFIETLAETKTAFLMLLYFLAIYVIVVASAMHFAERGAWDEERQNWLVTDPDTGEQVVSGFESIPSAFWFTVVMMTTTGFGDVVPLTPWGKSICSCSMFVAMILMTMPIAVMQTSFTEVNQRLRELQRQQRELRRVRRSLTAHFALEEADSALAAAAAAAAAAAVAAEVSGQEHGERSPVAAAAVAALARLAERRRVEARLNGARPAPAPASASAPPAPASALEALAALRAASGTPEGDSRRALTSSGASSPALRPSPAPAPAPGRHPRLGDIGGRRLRVSFSAEGGLGPAPPASASASGTESRDRSPTGSFTERPRAAAAAAAAASRASIASRTQTARERGLRSSSDLAAPRIPFGDDQVSLTFVSRRDSMPRIRRAGGASPEPPSLSSLRRIPAAGLGPGPYEGASSESNPPSPPGSFRSLPPPLSGSFRAFAPPAGGLGARSPPLRPVPASLEAVEAPPWEAGERAPRPPLPQRGGSFRRNPPPLALLAAAHEMPPLEGPLGPPNPFVLGPAPMSPPGPAPPAPAPTPPPPSAPPRRSLPPRPPRRSLPRRPLLLPLLPPPRRSRRRLRLRWSPPRRSRRGAAGGGRGGGAGAALLAARAGAGAGAGLAVAGPRGPPRLAARPLAHRRPPLRPLARLPRRARAGAPSPAFFFGGTSSPGEPPATPLPALPPGTAELLARAAAAAVDAALKDRLDAIRREAAAAVAAAILRAARPALSRAASGSHSPPGGPGPALAPARSARGPALPQRH
eukprot:tig00021127_g18760.t1